MVQLDLTIPTLVQHVEIDEVSHFQLRPLFVDYPMVSSRRYPTAITQFRNEIRTVFQHYSLNQSTAQGLFWYLYTPKLNHHRIPLQFKVKNIFIEGEFAVVRFRQNELEVACLPAFNNFMYITSKEEDQDPEHQRLLEIIKRLMLEELEIEEEDFDKSLYFAHRKDFLSQVDVRVDLKFDAIKYKREESDTLFASLFGDMSFEGITEINSVGFDYNLRYPEDLKRAHERDRIVNDLYRRIYEADNTPLVLVGKSGVGRHAIIQEVVFRYLQQHNNDNEQSRSLWHIDPNRIIAGMSIVGQWQQRFEAILKYLREYNHAFLVDNPIALLRIGQSAQSSMTLSEVLKPYLEKRLLQLVLIATPEEWNVMVEKNRSFSSLFQMVRIDEPDTETALRIILEQRKQLELEHNVTISITAIEQLMFIHRNYQRQKALPGGLMTLMNQLAVKYRDKMVDAGEVRDAFQVSSGLQERIFDPLHTFLPEEVEQTLSRQLIGQPDAVHALADVVQLYKAKLNDKSRPVSSLFFIGPTGVGKTHAAKMLARYLTGNETQLLRFDMNEYVDYYALSRLIGDYNNPEGQLTGKVRYQPYAVLLFDEIEKANPQVLDLLLQVLDDGRLTDSLGRTVDFTNTIIIMTSNVGAADVDRAVGFTKDDEVLKSDIYRKAMELRFRPEFINRIDKIVIFKQLELQHMLGIARLQINDLLQRDGFVRRTTILNISEHALEWVAQRGYDARMGGRALRRQIEQDLTFLSAEQLLNIHGDVPILMDIHLEGDHLKPSILPLEFAKPVPRSSLPKLPAPEQGSRFYGRLLKRVENLLADIQEDAPLLDAQSYQDNWQQYDFRTKADELKESLRTIRIAYSDNYFRDALATPLRLRQINVADTRNKDISPKEDIKAKYFQEAALKELSDAYSLIGDQFSNMDSEFLDYFVNVAFLELMGEGFLNDDWQKINLSVESLITGIGQEECTYLLDMYERLFEHLDLQYSRKEDENVIEVEAYSINNLLGGEAGIHLFYLANRNPLPVRVKINAQEPNKTEVVRIINGQRTITDLRTNLTNAANITVQELKLLIFAGLPEDFRQQFSR